MASLSFVVGIIGNVICMLLFASPIGTFWQVVKKKSTENYEALPYITTLLCTSLWVFYGFLKNKDGLLIVTVNGVGAVSQLAYVTLFLIYAPKEIKVKALKLVSAMNICFPGAIIMVTLLAIPEGIRPTFLGTLCAFTTIAMFASPLAVLRIVVKTKSVKYMPFYLSFFQFLVGGVWSFYALLIRDYFLGVPNAIGFLLGSAQLVLYSIYKNKSLSAKSTASTTMEEGGSAHLVIKGTMQMPSSMIMVNPK